MDNNHIDGHKMLWHLDRVAAWRKGEIIAPVYVEVSATNRCNHRCIFCGLDFSQPRRHALREAADLDTDTICGALISLGELGCRSVLFAGEGEPLLHQGLGSMIAAAQSNMDVALTTNGVPGTYTLYRKIVPWLTWLRFSVDAGTHKTYALVHGTSSHDYERLLMNIQNAVCAKRGSQSGVTISVQFVVLEENVDEIELHPKSLHQRDVAYTQQTIDHIESLVAEYGDQVNIVFRKESMQKYMSSVEYEHCLALPFWGYIDSHGDFYTCSVMLGDERFKAGNIYEHSMQEILFGERRRSAIAFAANELDVEKECRVNCRMARVNEFLEHISTEVNHVNFI